MRSLHLTLAVFCQVILASYILYLHSASATPIVPKSSQPIAEQSSPIVSKPLVEQPIVKQKDVVEQAPVAPVTPEQKPIKADDSIKIAPASIEGKSAPVTSKPVEASLVPEQSNEVMKKCNRSEKPVLAGSVIQVEPASVKPVEPVVSQPVVQHSEPAAKPAVVPVVNQAPVAVPKPVALALSAPSVELRQSEKLVDKPIAALPIPLQAAAPVVLQQPKVGQVESQLQGKSNKVIEHPIVSEKPVQAVPAASPTIEAPKIEKSVPPVQQAPTSVVQKIVEKEPQQATIVQSIAHIEPVSKVYPVVVAASPSAVPIPPVVKGGQGPLHLLAATLCSYQPERPVSDESLNLLYSQRAALRKSLFDFMSLKFTNLEKLSSKLNAGLEVMPRKTTDSGQPSVVPSHGWPVVGKCTAHDLKLMAEAAWCECDQDSACSQLASSKPPMPSYQTIESLDKQEPKIVSNKHQRRSPAEQSAVEQSSAVVSRMLHVNDVKDAPLVESSLAANLNLTQQQLAVYQAQQQQAGSSRACRRKALRLTKSLFNHLAEDQKNVSDSWPKLYAQVAEDDCARKRMIDIVTALSGFRGESTSIRRDNVEFAFAMDDLRTKVLESEVNQPLTFDKQFIEVEQFLQQSVKLMLANIDPERARLTSMRYRSLMPQPMSSDDQCIELHQRLLAKNYPTDCNPTQFGQLPDVLRMAANSLELWSIEKELSKHSAMIAAEYPSSSVASTPKQEVNECIANLVSS